VIGDSFKKVTGEVLTATEMNSFNSFENPETVKTCFIQRIYYEGRDFEYYNAIKISDCIRTD